ncbi:hypothetical protein ACWENR_06535 [Micromonospora sp. NPDC004336]
MTTNAHLAATPAAARCRSWLLFRATATVAALLVLGQAALAGGFLSGHYDALAAHALNGGLVALTLLVQAVTALVWWRANRGPSWPVRVTLIQLLITAALIPLGEQRILTVHVPLAVGLTVGVTLALVRAWRPAPGPGRRRTPAATGTEVAA